MNVIAHNATTIRNLAEIRHREHVPLVETQYQAQPPMVMQPITPETLPLSGGRRASADIKDSKKPRATPLGMKMKQRATGKAPENQFAQLPGMPATRNDFPNPMAKQHEAIPSSATNQQRSPQTQNSKGKSTWPHLPAFGSFVAVEASAPRAPAGGQMVVTEGKALATAPDAGTGAAETSSSPQPAQSEMQPTMVLLKAGAPELEKAKGKFSNIFKRSQKSNEEEQLIAKATKAVEDFQRIQASVPQMKPADGPISEDDKAAALERYRAIIEAGGADPFSMLMATENLGALDAVMELPSARNHSLSEDVVLLTTPASREHRLSVDALLPGKRAAASHALTQDKVINATPSKPGAHRLSADAMVPVRAAATGHFLDDDPTVSGPQQLFSHELLEDVRVLRPKTPQTPHGLDLDKKLAMMQKQIQPHSLHADSTLPVTKARAAHELLADQTVRSGVPVRGSHRLRSDALLPAAKPRATHELHADKTVSAPASAQGGHEASHDVRIVSPGSGQLRETHGVNDAEIIKETAMFRKSPHPDGRTMPPRGNNNQGPTSSGGEGSRDNNPMAALTAGIRDANKALEDISHVVGLPDAGKKKTGGKEKMGSSGMLSKPSTVSPVPHVEKCTCGPCLAHPHDNDA